MTDAVPRPPPLLRSDLAKFLIAWAGFLALVVGCLGIAGRIAGHGFIPGARAGIGGIAVAVAFIAAFAFIGHRIDRRFELDAVFRCIGGVLGLVLAAILGIVLYGRILPGAGP